jgi:hypothetical protein
MMRRCTRERGVGEVQKSGGGEPYGVGIEKNCGGCCNLRQPGGTIWRGRKGKMERSVRGIYSCG